MHTDKEISYYHHSGRVDLAKAPILLLIFLALAVLLSFAYSYCVVYIPLVGYANFLLTGGFALGVLILSNTWIGMSNVRNNGVALLFGFVFGTLTLYIAWACFEYVLINRYAEEAEDKVEWLYLLTSPLEVWGILAAIYETGWFSIGSSDLTGIGIGIPWAIEAAAIVSACAYGAYITNKDYVFCEHCSHWSTDIAPSLANFQHNDLEELSQGLQKQDLSCMENVGPVRGADLSYFRLTYTMCVCGDLITLALIKVERSWDKKGEEETTERDIFRGLLISIDTFTNVFAVAGIGGTGLLDGKDLLDIVDRSK